MSRNPILPRALGLALAIAPAAALAQTAPPPAAPGIDAAAMDPKANPCQDFFAYACGGWMARNEIPADKPGWGRFHELAERNLERQREILEAAAAGRAGPEDLFGAKTGDFYAACMDEVGVERTGLADLRTEWKRIDAVKRPADVAAAVGRLHRAGIPALFGLRSGQDHKDSTRVVAWVWQGGLSLPDRDYYLKEDEKSVQVRKDYLAYAERMLGLAGLPSPRARREAKAVFALEKAMAESHWTRVELREPERLYHPLDRAALQRATPRFGWGAYLAAVGAPDLGAFVATTPRALARIDELFGRTPAATWRAYLRWHLLRAMTAERALPRAFVETAFAFTSRSFTGAKELPPRWKHCVHAADGALGEALGQAFVQRHFGGDAKEKALRLVTDVQRAQGSNVKALSWMDDATRAKAQEKLSRIHNKIGYPARWRDYGALAVERGSFFRSTLAANAFEVRRDLDKIGRPLDRSEWLMTPPTVNAYYEPQLNEMVFPAGILQPPFYTRGANDAVNYGAAGFVVGHELTHGFDDEGRKYDAAGNQVDWWSPSVAQEFERRAACVEKCSTTATPRWTT